MEPDLYAELVAYQEASSQSSALANASNGSVPDVKSPMQEKEVYGELVSQQEAIFNASRLTLETTEIKEEAETNKPVAQLNSFVEQCINIASQQATCPLPQPPQLAKVRTVANDHCHIFRR